MQTIVRQKQQQNKLRKKAESCQMNKRNYLCLSSNSCMYEMCCWWQTCNADGCFNKSICCVRSHTEQFTFIEIENVVCCFRGSNEFIHLFTEFLILLIVYSTCRTNVETLKKYGSRFFFGIIPLIFSSKSEWEINLKVFEHRISPAN